MSKKKNLERAIVLGLILSTGICGSAWADTIHEFKGDRDSNGTITLTNGTVVTVYGKGNYGPGIDHNTGGTNIDYDNNPNAIYLNNSLFYQDKEGIHNLPVLAEDNVKLVFNNVNMVSPYIKKAAGATKGADIEINNGIGNGNTDFAGISISAIIEANSLKITSSGRGMYIGDGTNNFPIKDEYGNDFYDVDIDVIERFELNSASDAIFNEGVGPSNVIIEAGDVYIENSDRNGIYNATQANKDDQKNTISITADGDITIKSHSKSSNQATIKNITKGKTELHAGDSIALEGDKNGIWATKGEVSLKSGFGNTIKAQGYSVGNEFYGKGISVHAEGTVDDSTTVDLNAAAGNNELYGAVAATGAGANVNLTHNDNNGNSGSGSNFVYSAAVIDGAGDLDTSVGSKFEGKQVTSALYAENGANINLTGENTVGTWANFNDDNTLERTVWAYSSNDKIGSTINLTGAADIRTNNYELSPKSADVAVAAGTATGLTAKIVNDFGKDADDKRSVVNINYADSATGGRSYIQGDILAAYAGEVNINPLAENSRAANNAGITITGNLLAGNNGVLIVDLGKGGILSGRADDYGDAGVVKNSGHGEKFYDPAFSSDIYKGGDITLTMGDGSKWNVQGQSWITTLNTDGKVTIDLTNIAEEYKNYDSHALTIRNLNGNADIIMDLDGNRSQSDMLYIGQGNGEYNVELENLVTVDDMFADSGKGYKFSGLRFATVGMGSDVKFNVTAKDQGFNNVTYIVDTDVYNSEESKHENDAYNGESISNEKPGNSLVESMLDEAGKSKANEIMLLAADDEPVNDNETQHLNYKLVAMESSGITDAGKTMLNMSRANYSNAIYMDRLNKRLGEARYINSEEDEGMWVRIRHDRIGKDDAYRSQNTMYELGYDQKQECDNGERRVGMAIDYMHGDTGYNDIAGKGEIDRYGLWLYDTWMGDKGHYADYVAKWGHLSNDFEIYNSRGEVTGDYSNNVFSVSAEYGRKKDIGNDWYFEPQVQAQLARVTGADYTTSQGTKVSVDGINSLIGRAGFRLGKDFGEEKQSTVYIKADVLHEFLGDQDIRAFDGTTSGWQTVSYENEGTWYDVGLGFAAMMSKSSYAFLDLERSFGHDNDETYQINVGMQWSF